MSEETKNIIAWVLQVLLGAFFIWSAVNKLFLMAEATQTVFETWGLTGWFAMLIGVLELVGGILLFVPKFCWQAAAGLGLIMVGAIFTDWAVNNFVHSLIPLAVMILLSIVYMFRRPPLEKFVVA